MLVLLLAISASLSPAESPFDFTEYASEHYLLRSDLGQEFAEDGLAALEAAYKLEKNFYGAEPRLKRGDKLVVNCFSTQAKVTVLFEPESIASA
ncbi:MAG: hypothetical protein U5N86_12015 [Planctomycetota bacterium]|nr:hypothetical protein [Planctomycetota bacterium]